MSDALFDHSGDAAQVLEVLKDEQGHASRLLVKWGSGDGIVVEISDQLQQQSPLKIGDMVLLDPQAKIAFEKLPDLDVGDLALEKDPEDQYSDIAGLDDEVEMIRDAIEQPYLHRARLKVYRLKRPRGILLYGPPGCGKTMIGRAIANSLGQQIRDQIRLLINCFQQYANTTDGRERENCVNIIIKGTPPDLILTSNTVRAWDADVVTLKKCLKDCRSLDTQELDDKLHAIFKETSRDLVSNFDDLRRLVVNESETELDQYIDSRFEKFFKEELLKQLQNDRALIRLENELKKVHCLFLNVKGPELLSKWVGEAERRIRQVFNSARRQASYTTPVIIFFDEIESMFQKRGSGVSSDLEKTMVPQLLTEMDGVVGLENVIVIGATNRPELIDPALMRPGRFDIKIKINRPDRFGAVKVLEKYLSTNLPLATVGLDTLTEKTFSAEIKNAVQQLGKNQCCISGSVKNDRIPRLIPLQGILSSELESAIVQQVLQTAHAQNQKNQLDKRVSYADLASAIQTVIQTQREQLIDDRRIPPDIQEINEAVLSLEKNKAVFDALSLPLWPIGTDLADNAIQEKKAQKLVELAVEVLFSSDSYLRVSILAACGREYTFLLREFVSGALLSDIVTRAKRLAIKREINPNESLKSIESEDGICGYDVLAAIRTEFEENKEQLIANKPEISEVVCDVCKRRHASANEFDVSVQLGRSAQDRWHLPRQRPQERGRKPDQPNFPGSR